MSTICLKTNQHRLINNLRHAFIPGSMLGELLQNARRAQASHIDVRVDHDSISVSDDGTGIADLQSLIHIAESGWDPELQARENAFGMGVLSTLYFAEHLSVHSGTQAFEAPTAAILRSDAIEVQERAPRSGTMIRLDGVQSPYPGTSLPAWAEGELQRLCAAFPVRVSFNGADVPRPLSDPSIEWLDTPVGRLRLDLHAAPTQWRCYLQGLPIGRVPSASRHQIVLLRDDMIARLPDRQHLLDEEADHPRIQAAIDEAFRQGLVRIKERAAGSEFVTVYGEVCLSSSNTDLLNDVPFASRRWFRDWSASPPGHRHAWRRCCRLPDGLVAREVLEEPGVWQIGGDGCDESLAEVYLEARQAFLLREYRLDPDHWLLGLVRTLRPDQIVVRAGTMLYEEASPPLADDVALVLVDSLAIALEGDAEAIPVGAVRRAGTIHLTPDADGVTLLVSDYIFDDRYDEDCEDADAQTLRTFVAVGCSQDPGQVVTALLPDALRFLAQPRLAGATVRLTFDAQGKLASAVSG